METTLAPPLNFRRPMGVVRYSDPRTPLRTRSVAAPSFHVKTAPGRRWRVSAVCPADWRSSIAACGGGFFHTPVGLRLSTAEGEPRFLEYVTASDEILAIALASVRRCRFAARPRHAELPTWPALRNHVDWPEAMTALRQTLAELDMAEAIIGSYDADGESLVSTEERLNERREFRVRLDGNAEDLLQRCATNHRRQIRRGERSGWEFRFLHGDHARRAIEAVQERASTRSVLRGDAFAAVAPAPEAWSAGGFEDGWGAATIGAFDKGTLLSAAVIGWANRRAFYVIGGSSEAGYEAGGAAWMHWRAMNLFRASGGAWYNLGGTPIEAEDAAAPSHGLHRFKSGFGAERCTRSGSHWVLAPAHLRSHAAARWLRQRTMA